MSVQRSHRDVRKTLRKAFRTGLWVACLAGIGAALRTLGCLCGGDTGSWSTFAGFDAGRRSGSPRSVGRPGPPASLGLQGRTVRRAKDRALLLDELNAEQRDAVTAPDGVQLVVAGAGTGKTNTLTHRVAWLIMEKHVPPHQILLLTFTKAAAAEMIGRVVALVGDTGNYVQSGTFHSFAHNVLRRNCAMAGLRSQFTMLNEDDQQMLIKMILEERDYNLTESPKRVRQSFATHVATDKAFDHIQANFSEFPLVEDVFNEYQQRKRVTCTMDFDDLLVRLEELLAANPEVRLQVSSQYRYVLIDEYQDTDMRQARIADMVCSRHGNLMVVGDPGQSIYSFRGANVKNIVDFQENYPQAQVIKLGRNYRSTQPVLDVANAIVGTADGWGLDNKLISHLQGSSTATKPLILETSPAASDWVFTPGCSAVAAYIKDRLLQEPEEEIGRIGVLFRKNFAGDMMESMLQYEGVKCDRLGGKRFMDRGHIRDMVALWRVIVNPLDAAAWMRVLPWFNGIGPKTAEGIFGQISRGRTLGDVARDKGKKVRQEMLDFEEFKNSIEKDLAMKPENLVEVVDKSITWYTSYGQDLYADWEDRLDSMAVLVSLGEKADSLEALLSTLALEEPDPREPASRVTLATIHSAKGLEWDTVVIIYVTQGNIPARRHEVELEPGDKVRAAESTFEVLAVNRKEVLIDNCGFRQWLNKNSLTKLELEGPSKDELEEERRLFYVAVTRAKKKLMLMTIAKKDTTSEFLKAVYSYSGSPENLFDKKSLKPGNQTIYQQASKDKTPWSGKEIVRSRPIPPNHPEYTRIRRAKSMYEVGHGAVSKQSLRAAIDDQPDQTAELLEQMLVDS